MENGILEIENNFIKKVAIQILIPLILFLGLAKTHDILYEIYPMNPRSIAFGITINHAWMIFGILLLFFNIYMTITKKKKYLIGLVFFIISIILPLEAIEFRPFRASLLILMFFSAFGLSIMINQLNLKKETFN